MRLVLWCLTLLFASNVHAVECSQNLASIPTLDDLKTSGINTTAIEIAVERKTPLFLTSDESTFTYLVDRLKRKEDAGFLLLHIHATFGEVSENSIIASLFKNIYSAHEGKTAPVYRESDSRMQVYLKNYFHSGPLVVAIRFSPEFDPKTTGPAYESFLQPWLESLAAQHPIRIVGLTAKPQAFTNRQVRSLVLERGNVAFFKSPLR